MTHHVIPRIHLDPDGKSLTVEHVQDVEGILENNKALRSQPQKSDWGRHVASIPNVIITRWMNETGAMPFTKEFDDIVKRKLNDPDWAYLRTDK